MPSYRQTSKGKIERWDRGQVSTGECCVCTAGGQVVEATHLHCDDRGEEAVAMCDECSDQRSPASTAAYTSASTAEAPGK